MQLLYCCCIFFFLEEKEGDSTANTAALSASIDKLKAVDLDKKKKRGEAGGRWLLSLGDGVAVGT